MTDKKSVSLASLMTPSKTVTLDFPGYAGLKIDLCYLARDALLKLRKKCVSTKFDRKTRQPEEILDEDKFLTEYCKDVIKMVTDCLACRGQRFNHSTRIRPAGSMLAFSSFS